MVPQQFLAALGVPAFLVVVGVEDGDKIVELAAAQRVMHEVAARARPQHHVGAPEIFRHLVAPEHAAIGDMAGDARLAVADDALADGRPHAVAGDQRAAFGPFAILQRDGDAVAVILVTVDAAAGFERDQIARLAGLEEAAVNIGAVNDGVRLAEALAKRAVERDIGDELAGDGVAHFLRRRDVGILQHGVLEADLFQHAEDVGPELNAGADLAEFRGLFEQAHRKSLLRQCIGRDQAADPAAGDQKRAF